jgi:hypothetical protein
VSGQPELPKPVVCPIDESDCHACPARDQCKGPAGVVTQPEQLPKPYYEHDGITIYHGDCRDLFPLWDLAGAVMVTDPPYGRRYVSNKPITGPTDAIAGDADTSARDSVLGMWGERPALVFGTWQMPRPERTRHVLVWDKGNTLGMGDLAMPWGLVHEEIYVLGSGWGGQRRSNVLRHQTQCGRGTWKRRILGTFHPTEKPVELMRELLGCCPPLADVVDPFMGSGSTLRAAKDLGRKAIGIEVEERYCEIAAKRLAQEVLGL